MNVKSLLLIGIVLIGTCKGQWPLPDHFLEGLTDNINQMTQNIERDVQQLTRRIQQDVQHRLAHVNDTIAASLGNTAIVNGNTVVLGSGGTSRTIYSGVSPDGNTFHRDVEDRVIGDVLYHTERIYDPAKKTMRTYRYKLDLKDPKAKPVSLDDEN